MKNRFRCVVLALLLCAAASTLFAQENLTVFDYWKYHGANPSVSLYRHLYAQASEQLEKRRVAVEKLKTKIDWQQRQAWVKAQLAEAIGPFPAKTPLNPVVTGTLERETCTVEKLYFESRPGYFVTAALFLPKNRSGKVPAILYCSGHSAVGFRADVYQHTILNYVEKGFIVLAFDPIGQGERRSYRDLADKASPTKEHSYPGVPSFVAGLPPANYFVWDGIRAIDYLLSRPEVDGTRIGVTGRSGGGTQTAYIAALDDRVLAAAPECYITSFDKLLQSAGPQDAEQNLLHFLAKGLDLADLIEVRAPKPTLIVSTTRDMFSIEGVRETYQEAQRAFKSWGKPEYLLKIEDDAAHASTPKNREATYAFFQKYLQHPGSSEDLAVTIFAEEALYITPGGDVQSDRRGESLFSLTQKYTEDLVQKRAQKSRSAKDIRTQALFHSGYQPPSLSKKAIFSGRTQTDTYTLEKYLLPGSGDYYLPVLWLKPTKSTQKPILLLDDRGKAQALKPGELALQLVQQGHEVIIPDLSGTGELGHGYMQGGDSVIEGIPLNLWYAGILTHKSLVAVRAEEISLLAHFIKNALTPPSPLAAVACGTFTTDLLHAATFDNPFDGIVLLHPLASYQSITEERRYKAKFAMSAVAGALQNYDLPDLVKVLSGSKLLLINPVDATDQVLSPEASKHIFKSALEQPSGRPSFLRNSVKPEEYASVVLDWLK